MTATGSLREFPASTVEQFLVFLRAELGATLYRLEGPPSPEDALLCCSELSCVDCGSVSNSELPTLYPSLCLCVSCPRTVLDCFPLFPDLCRRATLLSPLVLCTTNRADSGASGCRIPALWSLGKAPKVLITFMDIEVLSRTCFLRAFQK